MGIVYMFAGLAITSVLFVSLFGFVAVLTDSMMMHTDEMLSGFLAYSENPTNENKEQLEASISDTDAYVKQASSMSAVYLEKYLDSIDVSILSGEDKKSIQQAKELLDSIDKEEITDPEVMEMQNKLNRILDKLEEMEEEKQPDTHVE